jgi:hypothetical protein
LVEHSGNSLFPVVVQSSKLIIDDKSLLIDSIEDSFPF